MDRDVKKYVSYDETSDSLYIFAKHGIEDRIYELVPGVNIELDQKGEIIGIEILRASRFVQKQPIRWKIDKKSYQVAKEPVRTYKTSKKLKKH